MHVPTELLPLPYKHTPARLSPCRLSHASELDPHWVSCSWLGEVGLPQYAQSFQDQLVDGRVLGSLSRRDLEQHLGVRERDHQHSLLLAVQLLQQLNFDKEVRCASRQEGAAGRTYAKCEEGDSYRAKLVNMHA